MQSDSIPGDLSQCGGVFVVGGHDGTATNLSDAEFAVLMTFMDNGGDVYVEGNELGRWIDPLLGGGSATANAFWDYFGCDFTAGNSAATGNVSSWQVTGDLPPMDFTYDYQGEPDDAVGVLVPTSADTLAVDQGGAVRVTSRVVSGSARVMATVLLGASTGVAATRADYIDGIIDLFDSIVATVSLQQVAIERTGDRVTIRGELSGYDNEPLRLWREESRGEREIALSVSTQGDQTVFRADDVIDAGPVVYRLELTGAGGRSWVLWQQQVDGRPPAPGLALSTVYPNPATGPVSLVVESDRATEATIHIYNVAGQRILTRRAALVRGATTLVIDDGRDLVSGVYFVRIRAAGRETGRKLHILR